MRRVQFTLKRWLPTSLFGRSLLIIILPVAVMQVVVTWIFFDAHWETVNSRLSEGLAGDIAWAVESYQDDPSPRTVEMRCDTIRHVRPCRTALSRWRISSSVYVSTADNASSSTRTRGSVMSARASAARCFWPPDSVMPRSPTSVS